MRPSNTKAQASTCTSGEPLPGNTLTSPTLNCPPTPTHTKKVGSQLSKCRRHDRLPERAYRYHLFLHPLTVPCSWSSGHPGRQSSRVQEAAALRLRWQEKSGTLGQTLPRPSSGLADTLGMGAFWVARLRGPESP